MGPLAGVRVIELGGIGPAPFCGMVLSDLGADVIAVRRPRAHPASAPAAGLDELTEGVLTRGRRNLTLDLKHPDGLATALRVIDTADVLIEGFRPGVAERLGVGPGTCLDRDPALVYGRITGWGQDGPLAQTAGHDLDYLAVAGGLAAIGVPDRPPVPPLNLVADFGGGGMLLATGVLAALHHARASGVGQVVDASMLEGSAYLMTMTYELLGRGAWVEERQSNANDGGAPFYAVYETSDHGYLAVGAMEPKFYAALLDAVGPDGEDPAAQWDRDRWPDLRRRLAEVFSTRTRDDWCERLAGLEVCVAPVLQMSEAPSHPHNVARRVFVDVDGVVQPAPAPRFGVTPTGDPRSGAGDHTDAVLGEVGLDDEAVGALRRSGAVG